MSELPTADEARPRALWVRHEAGIITLGDANTTAGYCRYAEDGEVEYLFVQSARRRQGLAMQMLRLVSERVNVPLRFRGPLSPSGQALVATYLRASGRASSVP